MARASSAHVAPWLWEEARLSEGLEWLLKTSFPTTEPLGPSLNRPPATGGASTPGEIDLLDEWVRTVASRTAAEAVPFQANGFELQALFRRLGPSLIRLRGAERFLLIVGRRRRRLGLIGKDGRTHWCDTKTVLGVIDQTVGGDDGELSETLGLDPDARQRLSQWMRDQRRAEAIACEGWSFRPRPTTRIADALRGAGLVSLLSGYSGVFTIDYLLMIASWWFIGRAALSGLFDVGWLLAWALLLLTRIPFRMLASWYEGQIAVAGGSLLKSRLLDGALRLPPDALRREGAGRHLSRVLESEAIESLALRGGLFSLIAGIQIVIASFVLAVGAAGPWHVVALFLLLVIWGGILWRYVAARAGWTAARLRMTHDLVERMVGHRTRLAQLSRSSWHDGEDDALAGYLDWSTQSDRLAAAIRLLPRAWMVVGFLALAPSLFAGAAIESTAVALGGVILVYRALFWLSGGVTHLVDAFNAWSQAKELYQASTIFPTPGDANVRLRGRGDEDGVGAPSPKFLLESSELDYQYPSRARIVLNGAGLNLAQGDRVLLTSKSGGGKSTLISLLNGLRTPDNGIILLRGFDLPSLGERRWLNRVATAPQFHENYVFTETLAFNLLMGRRWPPSPDDWAEAETLCQELGLGDLLSRMPGGMNQLVGETGWSLSHGERSRLFIARALLQADDVVILDESFGSLDATNALECLDVVSMRASTLVVVAHP